jgi:hypothetical protein
MSQPDAVLLRRVLTSHMQCMWHKMVPLHSEPAHATCTAQATFDLGGTRMRSASWVPRSDWFGVPVPCMFRKSHAHTHIRTRTS